MRKVSIDERVTVLTGLPNPIVHSIRPKALTRVLIGLEHMYDRYVRLLTTKKQHFIKHVYRILSGIAFLAISPN
jgi:hypothetical protein